MTKTMETTEFIWMDGQLVPWNDAKIHVLSHSLHYGSAVFEGIRVYETEKGPAIFRLKEHVERLFHSASAFNMKVPFSQDEISKAIVETVKVNKIKSGYIHPLIYFGYGKMGLSLVGAPVNVSISCWPWGAYLGDKPSRVKTSSFIRIHPKSSVMTAKITGHYENSILAGEEARALGYDEALLLDHLGNVAEGPGENLFIIKGEILFTPIAGNILPGITRDSIMKISQDLGYKVREIPMSLRNVYEADEAFFTGTAAEIHSLASLDDKKMKAAPGPLTKKIRDKFKEIVEGKDERYSSWLTLAV
jgi:branched-chain amino acid aminotransferase